MSILLPSSHPPHGDGVTWPLRELLKAENSYAVNNDKAIFMAWSERSITELARSSKVWQRNVSFMHDIYAFEWYWNHNEKEQSSWTNGKIIDNTWFVHFSVFVSTPWKFIRKVWTIGILNYSLDIRTVQWIIEFIQF